MLYVSPYGMMYALFICIKHCEDRARVIFSILRNYSYPKRFGSQKYACFIVFSMGGMPVLVFLAFEVNLCIRGVCVRTLSS